VLRGISIPASEKAKLKQMDIKSGQELTVSFDIWDIKNNPNHKKENEEVKYTVTITRGTNRLEPLFSDQFSTSGRHSVVIPNLHPPEDTLLVFSMVSNRGLYYEDTVHIKISSRFYVWIKYMVISPFIIFCLPIILRFST
jgi:hypothetical protein